MDPLFLSNNGRGVALVCTDASGAAQVALIGDGDSLVVTNIGDKYGFLSLSDGTIDAVAPGAGVSSYPMVPGSKEDQIILDKTVSYYASPFVAGVCAAGETTTLIVHLVSR